MLTISGPASRLCDRRSRRELLTIGGLSLLGWSLPQLLARESRAAESANPRAAPGFGKADSVILIHLQGSPSHIDLWDPKPDAPAEIRGEFKPIPTTAPGMSLGEVLPKLAEQATHFAVVRSIGVDPKGLRNHGAAIYMLMTGHSPLNFSPTGVAVRRALAVRAPPHRRPSSAATWSFLAGGHLLRPRVVGLAAG